MRKFSANLQIFRKILKKFYAKFGKMLKSVRNFLEISERFRIVFPNICSMEAFVVVNLYGSAASTLLLLAIAHPRNQNWRNFQRFKFNISHTDDWSVRTNHQQADRTPDAREEIMIKKSSPSSLTLVLTGWLLKGVFTSVFTRRTPTFLLATLV